jgi:hypothetical protein
MNGFEKELRKPDVFVNLFVPDVRFGGNDLEEKIVDEVITPDSPKFSRQPIHLLGLPISGPPCFRPGCNRSDFVELHRAIHYASKVPSYY